MCANAQVCKPDANLHLRMDTGLRQYAAARRGDPEELTSERVGPRTFCLSAPEGTPIEGHAPEEMRTQLTPPCEVVAEIPLTSNPPLPASATDGTARGTYAARGVTQHVGNLPATLAGMQQVQVGAIATPTIVGGNGVFLDGDTFVAQTMAVAADVFDFLGAYDATVASGIHEAQSRKPLASTAGTGKPITISHLHGCLAHLLRTLAQRVCTPTASSPRTPLLGCT